MTDIQRDKPFGLIYDEFLTDINIHSTFTNIRRRRRKRFNCVVKVTFYRCSRKKKKKSKATKNELT